MKTLFNKTKLLTGPSLIYPLYLFVFLSLLSFTAISCKGWATDYAKAKATLNETELSTKGSQYLGKKINVRGTVGSIDTSKENEAWVTLENGTRCNLGRLDDMAEGQKAGSSVLVAGFLEKDGNGNYILSPAIYASEE